MRTLANAAAIFAVLVVTVFFLLVALLYHATWMWVVVPLLTLTLYVAAWRRENPLPLGAAIVVAVFIGVMLSIPMGFGGTLSGAFLLISGAAIPLIGSYLIRMLTRRWRPQAVAKSG